MHHLIEPVARDHLIEAASDVGTIHAQVGASSELMLGLRVAKISRHDIREAIWYRRTLVKTVGLRGTLHLIPAGEVPTWMAANRLRFPAEERRYAGLGMNIANLRRLADAIAEIVGPEPITRPDLERALHARVGDMATTRNQAWSGKFPNWPLAMAWAAAEGRVCYGPGLGGRATYVRLADWAVWRDEDPMRAGVFVLRRFLRAYAPSTVAEFARWFALEPALAKELFARLAPEVEEVSVEGSRRFMLATDADQVEATYPKHVALVPQFDVFVVGAHPRDQLMPAGSPLAELRMGTAAPFNVLLLGGRVAGVWDRKPKGSSLMIRVDAHVDLTKPQRDALAGCAARIGEIIGAKGELEFGPVPLRRHL
ncbi:MAG TPA: winged helix DNA-binding domain-containing protein [Candidatus Dormibacteraeota bacterium]